MSHNERARLSRRGQNILLTQRQIHTTHASKHTRHSLPFNHPSELAPCVTRPRRPDTQVPSSNCMFVFLYDRLKSYQNHAINYAIRHRFEFRVRVYVCKRSARRRSRSCRTNASAGAMWTQARQTPRAPSACMWLGNYVALSITQCVMCIVIPIDTLRVRNARPHQSEHAKPNIKLNI